METALTEPPHDQESAEGIFLDRLAMAFWGVGAFGFAAILWLVTALPTDPLGVVPSTFRFTARTAAISALLYLVLSAVMNLLQGADVRTRLRLPGSWLAVAAHGLVAVVGLFVFVRGYESRSLLAGLDAWPAALILVGMFSLIVNLITLAALRRFTPNPGGLQVGSARIPRFLGPMLVLAAIFTAGSLLQLEWLPSPNAPAVGDRV